MSNLENRKEALRKEAMNLMAQKFPDVQPGSEEYNTRIQTYVDRNISKQPEGYDWQMGAVDASERKYNALPDDPFSNAVLKPLKAIDAGVGSTIMDIGTRGIPKLAGMALDAMGIKNDIVNRTAAADKYAADESAARESENPISSLIGGVVPDMMMGGTASAANPYRVISTLEKIKDFGGSGLKASGAGALSEALRSGGAESRTPQDLYNRAESGALWGLGGDVVGKAGLGTANWVRNAKNKMPRDLAIEEFKYGVSPEAAELSKDPLKVASGLRNTILGRESQLAEEGGKGFEFVKENAVGPDFQLPPSSVPQVRAMARDMQRPGASALPSGTAFDPITTPGSGMFTTLESAAGKLPQSYADRVSAIQELNMQAENMLINKDPRAEGIKAIARDMQKELDNYVSSSGNPMLEGMHYLQNDARNLYRETTGEFKNNPAISKMLEDKMSEQTVQDLLANPQFGLSAREVSDLVPGSKPYMNAMWMNENVGKVPLKGDTTAAQFHLGGDIGKPLDEATEAFLERISRDDSVSGVFRQLMSKVPGLGGVGKSDLSAASDGVIKYGKKPAQQVSNNTLASVLRGVLGAELGRYEQPPEDIRERTIRR